MVSASPTPAPTSLGSRSGQPGPVLPEPLIDLTDEETAVVFGTDPGLVATPYLDRVPEEERPRVLHTAYRSLLAHEVMREAPHGAGEEGADEHQVELSGGLAAIMDIREAAPILLCLQRVLADDLVLRYAHVAGDFVLVEDVLDTGLHRFGWLERPDLGCCLQSFLVPEDATVGRVPGGPDPVDLDLEDPEGDGPSRRLLDLLGATAVNVDATVRHVLDDGPGDLLGLFLGPAGSWCTRQAFGAGPPIRLEPLDPTGVGALLDRLVTGAEDVIDRVRSAWITPHP